MKLLTPREHKEITAKHDSKLLKEIGDIRDVLEKGIKALNEFRGHDRAERNRIVKDHAEFVKRTNAERDSLELEVRSLESRKAEALKPIAAIKENAKAILLLAQAKEAEVIRREEAVTEANQSLSSRESSLDERESETQRESAEILIKEDNLKKDKSSFESFMAQQYNRLNEERNRIRKFFEDLHKKSKTKNKNHVIRS